MKKLFLILSMLFVAYSINIYSEESYQVKYLDLLKNNDLKNLSTLLQKWEKEFPNDTEMFIAYFNYYLRLGSSSQLTMGEMDNGQYGIFNKEEYIAENSIKAINYLNKALISSPDRLDVYFGKCSFLSKTKNYLELTNTIKDYFNRSKVNNNKWIWSNNKSFESQGWSGEDAIFSGLNDYLSIMFNDFNASKVYIKDIVELESKLYPKNIWGINHAARYYDMIGDKEKSIELLRRAYDIDPSDDVILGNLAYTYEELHDYDNAIKYYNKLKSLNLKDATDYANKGIERINKIKK